MSDGQQDDFLRQECPYYMAGRSDDLSIYTTYDADGELLLNPLSPLMYSSATCAAVPLAGFGSAPAPELPPSSPSAL